MTNLVNCLENFQIYVGTYKKYREGSIFGEWLQLSNYSDYDELLKAMKELHKDEADPEFMIQDFECNSFFVNQNLISECFLSESIFEIAASYAEVRLKTFPANFFLVSKVVSPVSVISC